MKRALITGITGQDSAFLAKSLLEKGYKVFGAHRKTSNPNFWKLHHLNVYDKMDFVSFDLLKLALHFQYYTLLKNYY